ncbi:SDR family NAD(P)-dependent oxidoreductase [Dickeya fangzhongdai]|uniref:SDR family NAD(P)-dependent oxidoreductase n=1 Tax=Dickeya fangzhongdai TaxID=1778540 RepID=UPI0026E060F1|nr:SDR family oxidoreductase [Dickeya fangzhongdai]WKV52253.1 SDR family oxidoreductase [Dickeya fangzhongdai]
MRALENKVALVTGSNSGIGFAIAKRFAEEGASVIIIGRRAEQVDKAVASIGLQAYGIAADVTNKADLDQVFEEISQRYGKLDVLAANAAMSGEGMLENITEQQYDEVFDVNAKAVVFTAQKAIALMKDGGSIVLTSSIGNSMGTPNHGAYCASKAAVRSFARTWTKELAGRGIRVNSISPGPTEAPMFEEAPEEMRAALPQFIPLGRVGKPDEVAAAALFLASNESSYISGIDLIVDGGLSQV